MKRTVASELASRIVAMENCRKSGNTEWLEKHRRTVKAIAVNFLPRGSGFDAGTGVDDVNSTNRRLLFTTSFHHMDESGYTGWSEHKVIAHATFNGPEINVTGSNRNGIKDYVAEVFSAALAEEVSDGFLLKALEE